eukprot:10668883-Alexandrium_andersonii.AAC.1
MRAHFEVVVARALRTCTTGPQLRHGSALTACSYCPPNPPKSASGAVTGGAVGGWVRRGGSPS